MRDLILSVADTYQEHVMKALLPRLPVTATTREFSYDIIVNPGHDPGSYNESHDLLRSYINQYAYALVLLDYEGSGVEHLKTADEAAGAIEELLYKNGWEQRSAAIVIRPELENWMWVDNPNVERAFGWDTEISLYTWAQNEGYIDAQSNKPFRPKETLEMALRLSGTPKSASIYKRIATNVSFKACKDVSFNRLLDYLKTWFPAE